MSHVHPIEEQVTSFLAEKRRELPSRWSYSFYRTALERIFLPWALEYGITDVREVTVAQWNAYVDELLGRKLAIQSVLTYLRGVRILLVAMGFTRDQLKKLKEPKAAKPLLEILTREEIDRLEARATNERDKLIVRVLANTGIRLSELTGLREKDLREIAAPMRRYYRLRVWGKGSKEREVPIDRETYLRIVAFAKTGGSRAYIFPATQHDRKAGALVMLDGPRLSNNAVDKVFRALKKAAGITKPCTPHKLRHAYATNALRLGMHPMQLKDILGHADLSMITTVYSHLSPDNLSEEYERVYGAAERTEEPKKRRRIA